MYELYITPEADKIFRKLQKRNKHLLGIIEKKLFEICANPLHEYKFLRTPLQNFNRVHIDAHFVLIFRIVHSEKKVEVFTFEHHDTVYQWRP